VLTETVAITSLRLDPNNARKHDDKNLAAIKGSLSRFGQQKPLVVTADGTVVAGNGTLEAAKALGWDEIAVVRSALPEQDLTAFALADNRSAELAAWDNEILTKTLRALEDDGFPIADIGFDDFDLSAPPPEGLTDPDAVPENVETRCKPGDLWILGNHRLLCGDSTNVQHVERLMGGEKADMLFTDPPYGVNYEGGHFHSGDVNVVRKREKLAADDTAAIYSEVIPLVPQFVDGPCYTWFAGTKPLELYSAVAQVGHVHALIIWHKINATYAAMNAQYKQRHEPCLYWKPKGSTLRWIGPSNECTLWEMKRDGRNDLHPTQKPVELAERAINNHTAKTCLDLFLGSGSTLIACEKTNRRCFGMEIDAKYCDVVLSRWEQFTGKKATLHGNL
jgi:DNA modification methylase